MSKSNKVQIERTKIDLSQLKSSEQFEFFCDELNRRYIHQDSKVIGGRKDFPARIDGMNIGSSQCVAIKAPVHTLERTAEHIAKDDRHDVFLVSMFSGTMEAECDGREMRAGPGGLLFLDNAKPYSFKTSNESGVHSTFAVRLNRGNYLDDDVKDALGCEKRFRRHRLAALLKTSLFHLATNMNGETPDLETATLLGVVETLIDLISHDKSALTIDPESDNAAHLIAAEIARQLENDHLSLESVAHHLGISVERIEEIVLNRSTSFSDYVRGERLSLAMSRLCDEDFQAKTVEEIARSCGFGDMASFYRAFNDDFRSTPSEIRRASEKPPQLN